MQINLVFSEILKYLPHYDAVQATKPKHLCSKEDIFFASPINSFFFFLSLSQDAFVELYDRQRDSIFSCSWPSIKTVFGVAALGAASLTIGAYLAQK